MKLVKNYLNLNFNTKFNINFLFLIFLVLAQSCATRLPTIQGIKDYSSTEYETYLEQKTKKSSVYDGFYNKLTIQTTFVDSDLSDVYNSYQAKIYQWDEKKYQEEKNKMILNHSANTEFFVSFFTPEKKQDNLNSAQTSWKIYLEIAGQRYEGKVTKIKTDYNNLEVLFPHHNKWSTPYSLTFPVATSTVQGKNFIITVTGAMATTQISY